jgi:eukaryotic-like serine/threonine-protein kinase
MHVAHAPRFRGSTRFEVLREIGRGGAGSVYEAVDRESGTHVALKTLNTSDPESLLHLKHEFRSIQDLSHPNLVTPRELFEDAGEWFFSMEYVEGTDFLSYVRSGSEVPKSEPTDTAHAPSGEREITIEEGARGVLDEAKLRAVLRQLAIGVCALHAEHKVHRDLKPSNVLVDPDGRVRILDFGIVWDLAGERRLDEEGIIVGTIAYMAPEQGEGESVTPASDWYAVGVMLYQALTGRLPFVGTVTSILTRKPTEAPPAPIEVDSSVAEDLSALCVDLLRIDATRRPEGIEVLRRLGSVPATDAAHPMYAASFVGRAAELGALEAAFSDVKSGRAVTCFVEGESGVGKSALVRELATRVAAAGAVVLRGRCYERESVPYKGVDSLVDDLSQYLASLRDEEAAALLPDDAPLLRALFPVLDTVPVFRSAQATRSEVKNPQEARAQMFALLRLLLVNVALYRPLVLVVDDLQWADADCLALLSDVLRPPNAPPLLLLATIRTGTTRAPRGAMIRDRLEDFPGDLRWVHVDPLPVDAARALVRDLLSRASATDAPSAEIDAICAEAKGHPLFIDELVRHRALRESAAPSRLDDALFERASRLAPQARKLLELIAVAGVPVAQHIVAKATTLDFAQLFDAVGALRAAHFVRTSGAYRHDTVEAYHDRVRHSVLEHLDEQTQKEWHGRLALALEQAGETEPEKLVAHWLGAGEKARAAGYAIRAADEAAAALAFDHAASLYRLALDLGTTEGAAATALRVKAAEALVNAGRGAEAAALYLEAAGEGSSTAALDLRRRAGDELCCSGHNVEGGETIASVLRAVGVYAPRRPFTIILTFVFYSIVLAARGLKFTRRTEKDIDPRALLRIDSLDSAGTSIGMSDHVRGKMYQLRTLVEALALGEPGRIGRALAYYAAGHASGGAPAFERAMEMQRVVAQMAQERGDPYLRGVASLVAGFAYFLSGRSSESRAHFERAEVILREDCVGAAYELAALRSLLYSALAHAGELDALEARAEGTLREAEQRGDLYAVMNTRASSMAFLALARDDVSGAEREIALAATHLPPGVFLVQTVYCVQGTAQLELYRGEPAKAWALLLHRWPALRRSLLMRVQRLRVLMNETRARACLALFASGGADVSRTTVEKEIRGLEREGTGTSTAHGHLLRAGLWQIVGDREEALAELDAAAAGFDELGMVLVAATARRQRGVVLGGDEGRALIEESDAILVKRGVRAPARFAALYAPGFGEKSSTPS